MVICGSSPSGGSTTLTDSPARNSGQEDLLAPANTRSAVSEVVPGLASYLIRICTASGPAQAASPTSTRPAANLMAQDKRVVFTGLLLMRRPILLRDPWSSQRFERYPSPRCGSVPICGTACLLKWQFCPNRH